MYSRHDPRLRRTLNQLSQNLESANESAQANLFTFAHDYIGPCFASVGNCVNTCTASCFPTHEERLRRNRGRSRGRAELSFDFYDDWEEEENAGLLGWGNDELDRLLQGSYSGSSQPGRQRAMSYGTRRERDGRYTSNRRKSAVHPHDGGPDPTIIPSSSYFGFLGRLPWVGRKGLKYRPSAADLVEHPGAARRTEVEQQPLIEDTDEESHEDSRNHRRKRSATTGSGHTTDSLSSRGDIFPSEDELDDAVPLDDEFAMSLERRNTGLGVEDSSNGAARLSNKSSRSRVSTRTVSSRSVREHEVKTGSNQNLTSRDIISQSGAEAVPTLSDLKREEERIRQEEEADVERKRLAARELALKRGLASDPTDFFTQEINTNSSPITRTVTSGDVGTPEMTSHIQEVTSNGTFPFPAFDSSIAGEIDVDDSEEAADHVEEPEPQASPVDTDTKPSTTFIPARLPYFESRPD